MQEKKVRAQKLQEEKLPSIDELRIGAADRKVVGERLQTARKKAPVYYTQEEIAAIMQCSVAHISELENGKSSPDDNELAVFCRLYSITLGDIYGDIIPVAAEEGSSGSGLIAKLNYVPDNTLHVAIRLLSYFVRTIEEELDQREKRRH